MQKIKNLLTALETKKENESLSFYSPFTPKDTRFDESDSQQEFHQSNRKMRWVFGGNRSGKTGAGGAESVAFALGPDGERFYDGFSEISKEKFCNVRVPNEGWVVSSDHNVQVEGAQKKVLNMIPNEFIENVRWKRNEIADGVTLTNGSDITFKSSEAGRKSFEAAEKRWIWFDEEPAYESVFEECLMRESAHKPLHLWGTMTPVNGMTFIHDRIYKKRNENDNLKVFEWTTYDNPYLPDSVIENLESNFDNEEDLKTRMFGDFVHKTGLVFPKFDEEHHVVEPFKVPEKWDIYEGIDLGYKAPSAVVWVAVDPNNKKYVIDELYERGLVVSKLAERIIEKRENAEWTADKFYRTRIALVDPSAQRRRQPLEERDREDRERGVTNPRKKLRKNGVPTQLADNAVQQGIDNVRDELDYDEGEEPDIKVFDNCENFLYEIDNYRIKEYRSDSAKQRNNAREEPQKKDDHLMDAMRYVINEGIRYVGQNSMTGEYQRNKRSSVTGY